MNEQSTQQALQEHAHARLLSEGREPGKRLRLDAKEMHRLRQQGESWQAIADRYGVCIHTVQRHVLKAYPGTPTRGGKL